VINESISGSAAGGAQADNNAPVRMPASGGLFAFRDKRLACWQHHRFKSIPKMLVPRLLSTRHFERVVVAMDDAARIDDAEAFNPKRRTRMIPAALAHWLRRILRSRLVERDSR
jgi:hypothetical protein